MQSFAFLTATEIRFGRGTAGSAVDAARSLGSRIVLVHGKSAARAAWLSRDLSPVAQIAIGREPDVPMIERAVAIARQHDADCVVALGGGAVIDAGKAIAALVPATRPMLDHLEVVGLGLPLDHAPLPFVAIPTTAGTGAEVTRNAVIGVPEARRKVSLRDTRMLPRLAIIDPALTDNTPASVTLASGLDAITQVIEPFISSRANRITDALCRDAIPLGLSALVRLTEGEDPVARDDLAWASLCGGLALANAGLGAVHGLAGPLGGYVPHHGLICGLLLPHVLRANAAAGANRMDQVQHWIAGALGGPPEQALDRLAAWVDGLGLPRLGQLGLDPALIPDIAAAAQSSSSMKGNPVPLSVGALTMILRAAL